MRAARFSSAFTFQYSIRPGTPAATMDDQVPKPVVQERFERLIAVQEEVCWAENRRLEGREVEVLVAPSEGRKDAETRRLSGRARDNRLVHFAVPDGRRGAPSRATSSRWGSPTARRTTSSPTPASQGGAYAVRRTPGGDAWAALQDVPHGTGKPAVSLGMPRSGVPRQSPRRRAVRRT